MNQNLKFKIAFCLFTFYVIGVNCVGDDDRTEKITFDSDKKINGTPQIECKPQKFCDQSNVHLNKTVIECEMNRWLNETLNCTGLKNYGLKPVKYIEVTYNVTCPPVKEEEDDTTNCTLLIMFSDETPIDSHVGLIIGIIILVIGVILGLFAFLGYKGVGPMATLFKK